MRLEAVAQLLDRLGANAVDAQQVLLGLAHEVAHGLDAHLAELVGPALRHAEVVEEVQARVLGWRWCGRSGQGAVAAVEVVVADPVELLRELLVDVLELVGAHSGRLCACGEVGPSILT